jgi:fatty-acyl-CoA synthase
MNLVEDITDLLRVAFGRGLLSEMTPRGALRLGRSYARGRRDTFVTVGTAAVNEPYAVAVTDEERSWTRAELHQAAIALSMWLRSEGIQRRQRVAVVLENRAEWFVAMAALMDLGAVPLPMSAKLPAAELDRRLERAGCTYAIGRDLQVDSAAWQAALATQPARPGLLNWSWGQGEVMLHTSGTTGRSKGASISTSGARLGTPFRYIEAFDLRRGDRLYTPCPLYHGAPILLTGLSMICGVEVVTTRTFEPERLRECTHAFLVPTLMERLADLEMDLPQMRGLISGGALLRADTKRRLLHAYGPVLYDFYGATELGVVSVASPDDLRLKPHGVGRPLRGVEVKLAPDGELFVRSDMLTAYEGVDEDSPFAGWASAGDVARIEDDGTLVIVDRKKDMVCSGGVNLFPAEIEERVEEHPRVREAACAGRPDDTWGESLHCWFVGEATPDQLRAFCKERMAPYEVPKSFTRIGAVPRSPEGKVLRRALTSASSGPTTG